MQKNQGRLSRDGKIEYEIKSENSIIRFDDSAYKPEPGYKMDLMAEAYKDKGMQYHTAISYIDCNNIEQVLQKAIRGAKTYIANYQEHSGIKLFHDVFLALAIMVTTVKSVQRH